MISFHRDVDHLGDASRYAHGFERVDTDEPDRIARCISRFAWSPGWYANGHRREANFLGANWIGLDFDNGPSLVQAVKTFCDAIHVIGTTKSHRKEKGGVIADRYRVALKLDDFISDAAVYKATLRHYVTRYDADQQAKDAARLFWPCSEIMSVVTEGYTQEIIRPSPSATVEVPAIEVDDGELTYFVIYYLTNTIPIGERNDAAWRAAKDLWRAGFGAKEIFNAISTSKTYRGAPLGPDLVAELTELIASAGRSFTEERRRGGSGSPRTAERAVESVKGKVVHGNRDGD